tara:strand:+ start:5353 stop:6927 length:1575 start_codon:yes stop_codon:yes gene_type:complete
MGLLRYTASADNTIVNAYQLNLKTRGSGANAGASDVLEVFSIYGRISSASQELSRVLIKFPTTGIASDRTAGTIPASGSVSFYLKLFNAQHSRTTPIEYKLNVAAVTEDWEEGIGLDLLGYKDLNKGQIGSDWVQRKKGSDWGMIGGSYREDSDYLYTTHLSGGLENIEVNITPLVERWLAGTQTNYGVNVRLSASYEASASETYAGIDSSVITNSAGARDSYYTKRFFARGTQYFFKRPAIEARWDSSIKDDRANVYFSSSRAPAADNLNKIYFYNLVRGRLVNLPGIASSYGTFDSRVKVSLFSGSVDNTAPSGSAIFLNNTSTAALVVTGGWVSTGIYSCSVCFTASEDLDTLYDVWFSGSTSTISATGSSRQYFTGTLTPENFNTAGGVTSLEPAYYINITNLKNGYSNKEKARLNLYVREKNWSPTIYTVANNDIESIGVRSASYGVTRLIDNQMVVPYGTGSDLHTVLSYNVSGNYFDFDMNLLEKGYSYAFKFSFYDDRLNSWVEQDKTFKFRVRES